MQGLTCVYFSMPQGSRCLESGFGMGPVPYTVLAKHPLVPGCEWHIFGKPRLHSANAYSDPEASSIV